MTEISPGLLETALTAATTRQDGKRTSPDVTKRRYSGVKSVLRAAVGRELIDANPIDKVVWSAPRKSSAVNIATLPSVADVVEIVEEMAADESYGHYAAFFATVGFAGLRPSEVARLRVDDLDLPVDGWGEAHLSGALTSPGPLYTIDGGAMEEKSLKQRSEDETRAVPLPPVLVKWLRWHVERFKNPTGDRVFINQLGNDLSKDNWGKPWRDQRARRWPAGHKLARTRPYDLRHTAATMMLRAGVSPAEAALRLGHSVDMLMKIYAGVFEDERRRANQLIEGEFAELDGTDDE
ncbi:MAG: tyrosine-type recombinase/integrase [Actinomycetia bacterium]|nr:tyrosine-type recombinase/integrase [Actinomycetes bacterium]